MDSEIFQHLCTVRINQIKVTSISLLQIQGQFKYLKRRTFFCPFKIFINQSLSISLSQSVVKGSEEILFDEGYMQKWTSVIDQTAELKIVRTGLQMRLYHFGVSLFNTHSRDLGGQKKLTNFSLARRNLLEDFIYFQKKPTETLKYLTKSVVSILHIQKIHRLLFLFKVEVNTDCLL